MENLLRTEHSLHVKPEDPVYILHYGIKGMKWGVRRSPEELTAHRNKKAEKYEKKAKDIDKAIKEVSSRKASDKYEAASNKEELKYLKTVKAQELKNAENVREGKLTDNQKKVIKGAAIAGGIAVAIGAYSVVQSGEANRWMMKGKNFVKGEKIWPDKPSLSKKGMDVDELYDSVVKQINPDYGSFGSKMNCRRCTFAYEMRRRGKDVAATKTSTAHGQTIFGLMNATDPDSSPMKASGITATLTKMGIISIRDKVRPNADTRKFMKQMRDGGVGEEKALLPTPGGVFNLLRKQPDGARGELGVLWSMGGGHSVAWEIVKGKPVIFDTQTGKVFKSEEDLGAGLPSFVAAGITRLDNKNLNEEFLMRWLKNA